MSGWNLQTAELQIALLGLNVLLLVTWITLVALGVNRLLQHRPALRHGLLTTALMLILLTPLASTLLPRAGQGWPIVSFNTTTDLVSTPPTLAAQSVETPMPEIKADVPPSRSSNGGSLAPIKTMTMPPEATNAPSELMSFDEADDLELIQIPAAAETTMLVETPLVIQTPVVTSHTTRNAFGQVLRAVGVPLAIIWLTGSVLLLARLGIGMSRLRKIVQLGHSNTEPQLQAEFAAVCQSDGYCRPTNLLWSDRISTPISVGFLVPNVILPKSLVGHLTSEEWREVLIHEVSHLRRADPLVVMAQNLIGSLFWIHPLVHWLNRQLAQAREEVCDNHVLSTVTPTSYSQTLLKLASVVQSMRPVSGATGLFTSRWKLERRVAGLLDEHRDLATRLTWQNATVAILLPLIVGAMATFGTVSLAVEPGPQSGQSAVADQPAKASATDDAANLQGWPAPIDDGLLSLNLIVRLPDGTPAAETKVTSYSHVRSLIQKSNTDARGRVTIRDVFGHGANLHASTPDGKLQATLKISAAETRFRLLTPITVTLQPAVEHQVTVTVNGKPVPESSVTIYGANFEISGTTAADGTATFLRPQTCRVQGASAWHRELGVAGFWRYQNDLQDPLNVLSLEPVAPTSIRVVDDLGNAVPDLEMCATSLHFADGAADDQRQVMASSFPSAKIRTNAAGQASFHEAPRGRSPYLHFELLDRNWKIDRIEQMTASNRTSTVHVRRLKLATGRVIMPPDVTVVGMLISGDGFGTEGNNYGHDLLIRAKQDGTFPFRVPTSHGYCAAILDQEWYSDIWTGLILNSFDSEPAQIILHAQRAVPIKVRVTQGPDRKPYPDAMVMISRNKSFRFTSESGDKVNAMGSSMTRLDSDSKGEVRSGAPVGNITVSAGVGLWHESKKVKVTADTPVEVEFHCAAPVVTQKRELITRMSRNGSAYQPSASLKIYSWTDFPPTEIQQEGATFAMQRAAIIHRPKLRSDHAIAVTTTEDNAKVLAIDADARLAGFVKIQKDQPVGTIEMRPSAILQGTLVNENGDPLPNRDLQNLVGGSAFVPIGSTVRTDAQGKFALPAIPAELPIRLSLTRDDAQADNYRVFGDLLFEVGENRENAKVQAQRIADERAPKPRKADKTEPLSQRLKNPLRNARVAGMRVLVLLQGDESEPTNKLTDRLLSDDDEEEEEDAATDDEPINTQMPPVDYYMPLVVRKVSAKADVDFLKQQQWPRPKSNEIVLIALDTNQTVLGSQTLPVADSERSKKLAEEFLHQYKPVYEDAQSKLDAARALAAKTNRRVWVVSCGPRCGPCFLFAHWLESQRELLEQDFVLVKLMSGLQANADKINDEIGGRMHGIPWFVITEPDGTILSTSESPTGNIGMPSTVEDGRHMRKMLEQTARRLTRVQIDKLTKSLEPQSSMYTWWP